MYKTCIPGIYEIFGREARLPMVFDSPHSGREYPDDFNYSCDFEELFRAEDRYVDLLYRDVPKYDGVLLTSLFPRTYIDVNRPADDIDPEVIDGKWPEAINVSMRSRAGIGLVRRLLSSDTPLYTYGISVRDIQKRIEEYYVPYHTVLQELLETAYQRHGRFWHVNCHSMPSTYPGRSMYKSSGRFKLADFVIGDGDGTTCEKNFVLAIKDFLNNAGFSVAINDPYSGVEIVRKYSSPEAGRNSLQIEINRALYLDEHSYDLLPDFEEFRSVINRLIGFCAEYVSDSFVAIAAD